MRRAGTVHVRPGSRLILPGLYADVAEYDVTAGQHRLPVKVVINNNNALSQILWEQMVLGYQLARPALRRRARGYQSRCFDVCGDRLGLWR